jgi:hypothetical protein
MDTQPIAHIRCETAAKNVTTTWQEMCTGSTPLDGRKQIILYNRGVRKLYWSFNKPGAAAAADVRECNAIDHGAYLALNVADNIPVYCRTATLTVKVIVNELA